MNKESVIAYTDIFSQLCLVYYAGYKIKLY